MSRLNFEYVLVWIDTDGKKYSDECEVDLKSIFNKIYFIREASDCLQICRGNESAKIFIVSSGSCGVTLVPQIHDLQYVDTIIIYCFDKSKHEAWAKNWRKIVGVYHDISSVLVTLKQATKQIYQNSMTFGFIDISDDESDWELDHLEPSFMYTTLLKNLILGMTHRRKKEVAIFVENARKKYLKDLSDLKMLEEFAANYRPDHAIQWYTKESFLYRLLNHALRELRADVIVDLGFLINDIHRQLKYHHQLQSNIFGNKPFVVYRGQALSETTLNTIRLHKNGLLGFNSFLSTSFDRTISLCFAESGKSRLDLVGALFVITVDPKLDATVFASVKSLSATPDEEEILFSMHSIFRIVEVQPIADSSKLYEIQLTLTDESDSKLKRLAEYIEYRMKEKGWSGIAKVLIEINHLDKAEEIYLNLLQSNAGNQTVGHIHQQLGLIEYKRENFEGALLCFKKSLKIEQRAKNTDLNNLASIYNNIASVYKNKGEFSKSLEFYSEAITIINQILPDNHPDIGIAYNNIGSVYKKIGKYSEALEYYEKALCFLNKTLPDTHPHLANAYNNIGLLYKTQNQYEKALSYYKQTLSIQMKTLPLDHPEIAESYNNFGAAYFAMKNYEKATENYMKALHIYQNGVCKSIRALKTCYQNIAIVYTHCLDYGTAVEYYQKLLTVQDTEDPKNYIDIVRTLASIGLLYLKQGNYSEASKYYEQSLENSHKIQPEHPEILIRSYVNLLRVYLAMNEYSRALSLHKQELVTLERILPDTHPQFADSYSDIGSLYELMGDYAHALSFYEKALSIWQVTLPENHPKIAKLYSTIESLRQAIEGHVGASYSDREVLATKPELLAGPHLIVSHSH